MKNFQKRFAGPLLILIVVVVGVYIYSQNKNSPTEKTSDTATTTATSSLSNISTTTSVATTSTVKDVPVKKLTYVKYTSPNSSFEFKYPTGWIVKTNARSSNDLEVRVSPVGQVGANDPIISVEVATLPLSSGNFATGGEVAATIEGIKKAGFVPGEVKELFIDGDDGFSVSYKDENNIIKAIYIVTILKGIPDAKGTFPTPLLGVLQYKAATKEYSENILNTLISSYKENFAATHNQ